jgi:putative ABC transport system permease protein
MPEEPEQTTELKSNGLASTDIIRLAVRVFKTKPLRTSLTIFGMSIGIATVLFLVSLGYGLQYILIGKLVTTEDSLITMEVSYTAESNLKINAEGLKDITAMPLVGEVSPVGEFSGELRIASTTGLVGTRIISPSYFRLTGLKATEGDNLKEGESEIMLNAQAVKLLGLSASSTSILGSVANVVVDYDENGGSKVEQVGLIRPSKIVGIGGDDSQPPTVLVPLDQMSKQPPYFKSVLVKAKTIDDVTKLRDQLLEKGFAVLARIDLVNQARQVTNIFTMILGIFGVTALIVSSLGMLNTMIVGFMERIYEVGVMKSLGATDSDIKKIFLMESSIMGFLGGVCGVVIGVGGGKLINLILSIVAVHFGGTAISLFMTPWWFVIFIIFTSFFIGTISGFWPAKRAALLSPKEAFIRK